MRNLTVKRCKSFVGCLAKANVYIEDHSGGDVLINGVFCRKLGELKNGEEKTFQIDTQAAKIFVANGKRYLNSCEYFQLPEGDEDLIVSGRYGSVYASLQPFRFDNNNGEDIKIMRRRSTGKAMLCWILCAVVGAVIGTCLVRLEETAPKKFSVEGLTITLTEEFSPILSEYYVACYGSDYAAVMLTQEKFALAEGWENNTVDEYIDLVIGNSNLTYVDKKHDGDLVWFEYEAINSETNKTYFYCAYAYKSSDSFWLVTFGTSAESASKYTDDFMKWARSVQFE